MWVSDGRSLVAGTFETASLVVNLCAGAEGMQARVEALESGAMLDLVKLLTAGWSKLNSSVP